MHIGAGGIDPLARAIADSRVGPWRSLHSLDQFRAVETTASPADSTSSQFSSNIESLDEEGLH